MEARGLNLDYKEFLLAVSRALDAVEGEVLGAVSNHSKRVAYLGAKLGRRLGMTLEEQADFAACAAMHDNGLTEYVTIQKNEGKQTEYNFAMDDFKLHCIIGEKNVREFPFFKFRENVVLYHHENYDGSGFFGIKGENIPLMARILRMLDQVDVRFPIHHLGKENLNNIHIYLRESRGSLFDPALTDIFEKMLYEEQPRMLEGEFIEESLKSQIPQVVQFVPYDRLIKSSSVLAHIIDYKSPFTMRHSTGIAEKTRRMAEYYEFDGDTMNQVHIAAFLHDVGKLAVPNLLLEKPGKLTADEFEIVKRHVWYTHEILSVIDSFKDIERWASGHHERLDGSGYFRGCKGDEQDLCTRLLECIDMFQALIEDRPYRRGMEPEQALRLLEEQALKGKLDKQIVSDIGRVYCS